jgi:GxxExxY protein
MKPPRIHTDTPSSGYPSGALVEAELTNAIIGAFFDVYNELGHGFLESVYRKALQLELRSRGPAISPRSGDRGFYCTDPVGFFRADPLVERRVIVEVKAINALAEPAHKQLLNYLRATSIEVRLLLNFGPKPTFKRVVLTKPHSARRGRIPTFNPPR